jgi:hypothetical protein
MKSYILLLLILYVVPNFTQIVYIILCIHLDNIRKNLENIIFQFHQCKLRVGNNYFLHVVNVDTFRYRIAFWKGFSILSKSPFCTIVYGFRVVYRPMQNLAIYFYPWPLEVCALDHLICNRNSLFSFINKHPYKMFRLDMNTIINKVFETFT